MQTVLGEVLHLAHILHIHSDELVFGGAVWQGEAQGIEPHVHFYCKNCGKIIDLFDEQAPRVTETKVIDGNIVQEEQLYYKGICSACAKKMEKKTN